MGVRIKETYEVYHENMAVGHLGVAIKNHHHHLTLLLYYY